MNARFSAVVLTLLVSLTLVPSAWATYSPRQGRFLQQDPIEYQGGINLYQYVGGNSINRVDPRGTEFIDQGRVGQSTMWWFGGKAGQGLQGIGEIKPEDVTPPEIVVTIKENGKICAHVKKNTGIAKVFRGYTGVQAGDQGIGTPGSIYEGKRGYITQKLAAGLDAHEQGHVDASKAIYASTLGVAEVTAKTYWTKEICCCPSAGNATGPADVLKSRIAWVHWMQEFINVDKQVNSNKGYYHYWETQQGGGPRAEPQRGTIDGTKYDVIYKSREETETAYTIPNYNAYVPVQPRPAPQPSTCEKMTENVLP